MSINRKRFLTLYAEELDALDDAHNTCAEVAGERDAVQAFDALYSAHPEFIMASGIAIGSDTEAAAFMFALEKYMSDLNEAMGRIEKWTK